jgi:hypothetical protein
MLVLVAGPRTQRTTAYPVPRVPRGPRCGARNLEQARPRGATGDVRAESGTVWVFDPQHVAGEDPTWWSDPLTYFAPLDPKTAAPRSEPLRSRTSSRPPEQRVRDLHRGPWGRGRGVGSGPGSASPADGRGESRPSSVLTGEVIRRRLQSAGHSIGHAWRETAPTSLIEVGAVPAGGRPHTVPERDEDAASAARRRLPSGRWPHQCGRR